METCLDIFVEVFNQLEQQISLENIQLLSTYSCLNTDFYYKNFSAQYFTTTDNCFNSILPRPIIVNTFG